MSKETISNETDRGGRKPAVALIAGPTASGKSELAVRLALASEAAGRPATVINADSAQVYADLAILSARPDEAEMCGVQHRLFGAWDGATPRSAADWARAAKVEIDEALNAGRLPILVGGTGLYMRTLIDGIAPVPAIDPAIRAAVRALPVAVAHEALTTEDPEAARRLNPADTTRTARALEVVRSTGSPLADWQKQLTGGIGDRIDLTATVLLPDRSWLNERCDRRFAAMLDNGAVEEVRTLLNRRLNPQLPVMRAIGVREIAGWLDGEYGRDTVIERGALATRQYAKRQYTWFRNQPPQEWKRVHDYNSEFAEELAIILRRLLLT